MGTSTRRTRARVTLTVTGVSLVGVWKLAVLRTTTKKKKATIILYIKVVNSLQLLGERTLKLPAVKGPFVS